MALLDQLVVAFETKNSKGLEQVLRKITQKMKELTVEIENQKKISDEASQKRISQLKEEFSSVSRISGVAKRRKSELDKDYKTKVSYLKKYRKEAEKDRKAKEKSEALEHKETLRRIKEEETLRVERIRRRNTVMAKTSAVALYAINKLNQARQFSERSLATKAVRTASYKTTGIDAGNLEGLAANIYARGGDASEAYSTLSNITNQLGSMQYGDSSLVEALGQFGIGGINAFSNSKDVLRAIMAKAQGMNPYAQQALFSKMGFGLGMQEIMRSGDASLLDAYLKPVSEQTEEEKKSLRDIYEREKSLVEINAEISKLLSPISKSWNYAVDNWGAVGVGLGEVAKVILELTSGLSGFASLSNLLRKKWGIDIPKGTPKGTLKNIGVPKYLKNPPNTMLTEFGEKATYNPKLGRYQTSNGKMVSMNKLTPKPKGLVNKMWTGGKGIIGKTLSFLGSTPFQFVNMALTPNTMGNGELPFAYRIGQVNDPFYGKYPMPLDSAFNGVNTTYNNGDSISGSYNNETTNNNYYLNGKPNSDPLYFRNIFADFLGESTIQ